MNEHADNTQRGSAESFRMQCETIQSLLFDYLNRELGEARSDLVREHLRRCETCQARAAEIQGMLDVLSGGGAGRGPLPDHLTEDRHARLVRAAMHPVLDWIYMHHVLMSALTAAAILAATLFGLWRYRIWQGAQLEPGIPVRIGRGDPGALRSGRADETRNPD